MSIELAQIFFMHSHLQIRNLAQWCVDMPSTSAAGPNLQHPRLDQSAYTKFAASCHRKFANKHDMSCAHKETLNQKVSARLADAAAVGIDDVVRLYSPMPDAVVSSARKAPPPEPPPEPPEESELPEPRNESAELSLIEVFVFSLSFSLVAVFSISVVAVFSISVVALSPHSESVSPC